MQISFEPYKGVLEKEGTYRLSIDCVLVYYKETKHYEIRKMNKIRAWEYMDISYCSN